MTQKTEQKQKSHDAILASAAALLLERGIQASSIMDVMKGAGLTVGGFYGHFESKEHLFTETLRGTARTAWNALLRKAKEDAPDAPALKVLERYLSRKHRDAATPTCPLPSITAEVSRTGEPYRGALEAELQQFVRTYAELLPAGARRRDKALAAIALMYGALSLARAVRGTKLGDEFLDAARKLGAELLTKEGA
ncbi:TetR/AcrR family transcriptional regulator [Corallococcus sp. AB049A]|uniref:TetR/AcrR family transcriptional regulator n=1 Tax=Corallococcus interemptor TaxID=2316720 RepID=A0A3A8QLJ6_9BACT|nr:MULTISPECIES: TetR/AcrR family transcriptional regulator [Corallococcus]RKH54069.1 TetR/AcrR family transcriptional regulator [Corallococcus sp. AB050B]RKH65712.1 TetR/AcrR family transcriptional regulator [Corallococcus interemptor]RKI67417.1 TetR/AcrR family transcriptional regulator [Corallococcus sp. AB049A]